MHRPVPDQSLDLCEGKGPESPPPPCAAVVEPGVILKYLNAALLPDPPPNPNLPPPPDHCLFRRTSLVTAAAAAMVTAAEVRALLSSSGPGGLVAVGSGTQNNEPSIESRKRAERRRRAKQLRRLEAAPPPEPKWSRLDVCPFEELPDDLTQCIFQIDRDTGGEMARLALLSQALRPAAASVERLARARAKETAAAAAAAEKVARQAAVLAAEASRASLEGWRLSVLMDARSFQARWVDAVVKYYVPGSKPTLQGMDSFYALNVNEHDTSYHQEVWASRDNFADHCCMCMVSAACALCAKEPPAEPSYRVIGPPAPGFVVQRPGGRSHRVKFAVQRFQ